MSTRTSYDAVATRYAAEIGDELAGKPADRELLDRAAHAAAGGLMADVGGGPGHVAAYLNGRGARTLAFDLSAVMCAVASTQHHVRAAAADMTALPVRSASLAGLVCLYAVIHLDPVQRRTAYAEFARVLVPGGRALVAFHIDDADVAPGGSKTVREWWGHDVDLTFRFLDPDREITLLADAGLALIHRLDREPYPGVEHASRRSYLTVARA